MAFLGASRGKIIVAFLAGIMRVGLFYDKSGVIF